MSDWLYQLNYTDTIPILHHKFVCEWGGGVFVVAVFRNEVDWFWVGFFAFLKYCFALLSYLFRPMYTRYDKTYIPFR